MDKRNLMKYGANKKEIALIDLSIEQLNERLLNLPEVSGKVTKSSDDFPYIEEHITVRMTEPKAADSIKRRISEKELRREKLLSEQEKVETFINAIPDGTLKEVFEMVYLNGMSLQFVGDIVGYTKGRVSQIISDYLKD